MIKPGNTINNPPPSWLGSKDAHHCPGVFVTSASPIIPGRPVRFLDPDKTQVEACEFDYHQAIADPFLKIIQPNTGFWVFVRPDLVSDLTHHFQILAVPDEDDEDQGECAGC